jgi:hypothetical protein
MRIGSSPSASPNTCPLTCDSAARPAAILRPRRGERTLLPLLDSSRFATAWRALRLQI